MAKEYIEREAAYRFAQDQLKKETGAYSRGWNHAMNVMKSALHNNDALPAADVAPVRHGEWIGYPECLAYEEAYSDDHIICSVCTMCFSVLDNCTETFKFCPNCGARMDGVANVQNCEKNHLRPTNMSGTKCEPCKPTQPECGDCEYIKDGDGDA